MKITTRKLAVSAILLAADVLLTRVFAFNTPLMKIGLGWVTSSARSRSRLAHTSRALR